MSRQENTFDSGRFGTPTPLSPQPGFTPVGVAEMMPSAYNTQNEYIAYSGQYGQPQNVPYSHNGANAVYPDQNPQFPTSPPPPHFVTPAQYYDKQPPAPVPVPYAAAPAAVGAGAAMGAGVPPEEKTICGVRRKVFFIVLAIVIVLIIAGLAAGLAVALTRKDSSSSSNNSQADGAGAGTTSLSTFIPSIEPTDEPSATAPSTAAETTAEETIFTTSPPETSTIPDIITPTITRPTTSRTTASQVISAFSLETGYNTLSLELTSTTGNSDLCSLLVGLVSVTTTVYPSIVGNVEDLYTAYWQLGDSPGTLSAVGQPPEPTARYQFWTFDVPVGGSSGGCSQEGTDSIALEESGVAIYSSGLQFTTQCSISGYEFEIGDFCYLYWIGEYSA
ncbi:hypothetical protein TWF718_000218 [Orbilia javanica]|uniref:Uncharacterized protein n=1 Tax=Orbilia javanica TaxID=47235 RepID=A0AAN8MTK9_9PEZI